MRRTLGSLDDTWRLIERRTAWLNGEGEDCYVFARRGGDRPTDVATMYVGTVASFWGTSSPGACATADDQPPTIDFDDLILRMRALAFWRPSYPTAPCYTDQNPEKEDTMTSENTP